jgi:5-methylcytosine-specific restriction endonuclease McrA
MPGQAARDTYLLCISRIAREPLKKRMAEYEDFVAIAAERYDYVARDAALYTLDSADFTPASPQDRTELIKVYTNRMAKEGAPGRPIYNTLKLAAKRCPLCGHRDVSTLDHYLPKTLYSLLCVTPTNLVPACSDCNKAKSDALFATAADQTLHPYFDNVDQDQWLKAEVVQSSPPALVFFDEPPQHWATDLAARVRHHFKAFGLADLYGSQAAAELAEIAYGLAQVHEVGGEQAVKEHLELAATSRGMVNRNHWRTAAYRALVGSPWYCSGGFAFT